EFGASFRVGLARRRAGLSSCIGRHALTLLGDLLGIASPPAFAPAWTPDSKHEAVARRRPSPDKPGQPCLSYRLAALFVRNDHRYIRLSPWAAGHCRDPVPATAAV